MTCIFICIYLVICFILFIYLAVNVMSFRVLIAHYHISSLARLLARGNYINQRLKIKAPTTVKGLLGNECWFFREFDGSSIDRLFSVCMEVFIIADR